MPVASLPSDAEAMADGFFGPAFQRRREVLRETLAAFSDPDWAARVRAVARGNLARWADSAPSPGQEAEILVIPEDWGVVTRRLTQRFGVCFAVLNMANPFFPGGAYGEGAPAQEENMFRRTDCHFSVDDLELAADGRTYTERMTMLISGAEGRVYVDALHPRTCVRGPERPDQPDLGYARLADDDIFPFYELRAAAQDLRDGSAFSAADARRRIAAVLDTLTEAGIRHAVLGALGCGAFANPAEQVAELFREEIHRRRGEFAVVAFAIRTAGYGPDNFGPFHRAFCGST